MLAQRSSGASTTDDAPGPVSALRKAAATAGSSCTSMSLPAAPSLFQRSCHQAKPRLLASGRPRGPPGPRAPMRRRAARVVVGDPELEDEERLAHRGGVQLRKHVLDEGTEGRAAIVVRSLRAACGDAYPIHHVIARVIRGGGVPPGLRVGLGGVMERPGDVARAAAAGSASSGG